MDIVKINKPIFGLSKLRQYFLDTDNGRIVFRDTQSRQVISIPLSMINELDVCEVSYQQAS